MPDDKHRYPSSIVTGIPDLFRESIGLEIYGETLQNLSRVKVFGFQSFKKCCPIYAPPALLRLPKIVLRHYARVCESSQASEKPGLGAPAHDGRSTDVIGRHASQSPSVHGVNVDLIFDIALIDDHKFILNAGNIFEAGFFIFRKDVVEFAAFGGLGEINSNQLVIGRIFVGYEVELQTVIGNAISILAANSSLAGNTRLLAIRSFVFVDNFIPNDLLSDTFF